MITIFGTAAVFLLAGPLTAVFTADPVVIAVGRSYLKISAFILCAYVILSVDVAALQGIRKPMFALWIGLWLGWILASEVLIRQLGLEQAPAWLHYPLLILVLRILAIGVLGPIAEELAMRGIVFFQLRRRLGNAHGAIVIVAILWAAMHYHYGPGTVALIGVDGLLLGYARHRGGSLWIPIAMHTLGNLVSIGQSLMA